MAALAGRQCGRIAGYQLNALGLERPQIRSWVRSAHLIRRLPGVFAVGHDASSVDAVLTEALLYAGPGAMLTGAVGAWWLGLRRDRPALIEVATPRKCRSLPGIDVRSRRRYERTWHRKLPVAPVADVLLDYGASATPTELRRALANAEYLGLLDLATLESRMRSGRDGAAPLRAALRHHQPELAHTASAFERLLLRLCEREQLPVPKFNRHVEGFRVDALWASQHVIVELDGRDGHSSWARIRDDRSRDLALRRAGYVVLRYVWEQVANRSSEVAADIRAALGRGPVSI